ncbi:hypothetical protein RJF_1224 [Candidozyma auris]
MSQTSSSSHASRSALSATEFESTLTFFRLLKVTQLKELCKSVGLALKGKKQDLLYRLESYTRSCYAAGENIRLLAIRSVVLKMLNHDPVPDFHNLCHALQSGLIDFQQLSQQNSQQNHRLTSGLGQVSNRKVSPSTHTHVNPMAGGYSSGNTSHGSLYYPKYSGPMLLFQSTIFYQLIRMVHGFPYMMVASKGRNVCNVPVSLNAEEIELLEQSPDARLYLFSGLSSTPNPAKTPIQFPPIEIHVDGINTKQYVKGLKGKPGTCRPADLTKYVTNLRRQFTINIVYSDALEPYILYVYIVHARSPENLVTSIEKEGSHIPIDVTKKAIQRDYEQNQDDDIVMDTSSISLRCPLTYARMKHPMKSTACDHVQCFDGLSFLTMQERIPSWICPVCSAQLDQNSLAVSDYMCEILSKTSEEVDTVLLHTDGSWSVQEDSEMKDESSSPPPKSPSAAAASTRSEPPNESIEVISLDSESEDEAVSSESASAQETRQGDTTQERGESSSDNDTSSNNRHEPSENTPLSKHRRKAPVIQDDPDSGSDSRSLPPVRANDPNRRDLQRSPPVRAFDESASALNQASPQNSYHESPILPAPRSASPQNVTRLPSINTLNQNLRNGASSTHNSGFIVPWARDQPISSSSSPEVAKNSSSAYVSGQQVSNASAMAQQQSTAGSAHGWRGAATNGINSPEPDRITEQTNRKASQKDSPELSQLSKAGSVIQKIHQQYSRSSSPSAQQPQASSSSANRSALTSSGSTQETQANANAAATAVTSLASADTDQQNTTGEKGVSHEAQSLINESQKTGIPHQRERQSQVPEVNQQPPNARQSVIAERYRQLISTSSTLINNYHKMALDTNHSNNSGIPNVPSTSQSANSQPQEGSKREISGVEGRENDATRIQQSKSERTEEQTLKEGNNTGDSMSATEVSSSTTTKGNSEQSTETTADVPALLQAQAVKPSAIQDSSTTTSEMMQKTSTGMTHSSSKNRNTRTEQEHQRSSEPEHNRPAPEPARAENYSRSAFDVLTEEDAFQKIKGVLDIEISGNLLRSRSPLATQASEPSALPSGTAVHSQSTPHVNRVQESSNGENTSPIDSRIERMSIETPNGKKRSISNSSSERSWNKRLNRQGSKKFDPSEINSSQIIELDD